MDTDGIRDEIKRRVDIAEVISQYVPLQRSGRRLRACCPFHQEKTPSFYVDPQGGFYKCFGCGEGGDVFSFVMKIEGLTFPEAGERLAEKVGLQWQSAPDAAQRTQRKRETQHANEIAAAFFADNLFRDPACEHAREYVRKRGFTGETVKQFGLGFALDEWESLLRHLRTRGIDEVQAESMGLVKTGDHGGRYDVFRNRLMFPITDVTGRIIAFGGRTLSADDPAKYLNTPETAMFKKGQTVYALPLARQAISELGHVIVTEGYTDVISLHQAGVRNVVACLGTAMTEDHLRLLQRYTQSVVLTYDADAAGMAAALRNVALFEGSGVEVKVAVLPPGEDPDECVRRVGPEGFRELLGQAVAVAEYELRMIFARHAGEGADGLTRAAQEAGQALARVSNPLRRDEFITRAVDYWGRGNTGRSEMMERALRLELRRHFAQQRAPRARGGLSPRDRGFIFDTAVRHADSAVPPGQRRLEEDILAPALNDRSVAEFVFTRVAPEEFLHPISKVIAEAMLRQLAESPEYSAASVVDALAAADEAQDRARYLSLRDESAEVDWEPLQTNIDALKKHASGGGLREDYEVGGAPAGSTPEETPAENFDDLRRRVVAGIEDGTVTPDSPDYVRYMDLVRRFRGRGDREFAEGGSRVSARRQVGQADAGAAPASGE